MVPDLKSPFTLLSSVSFFFLFFSVAYEFILLVALWGMWDGKQKGGLDSLALLILLDTWRALFVCVPPSLPPQKDDSRPRFSM